MAQRISAAIPVVVVAGFLGSGKTTLLNHLLRNSSGMRIGVLVNDFGAVNVDALLVASQVDSTMTLSNGCMCCTVDADELETTLATLVRPRRGQPALDAIVIEASGVAEPGNVISMVCAAADSRIRFGGLVYVVDARHHVETAARHRYLRSHVALADLVVVNKADLCSATELESVKDSVREANSSAPQYVTTESQVALELLFDRVERVVDDGPRQLSIDELLAAEGSDEAKEHDHQHLHDDFASVTITSNAPLHPRRLAELLERPPNGVYRVKGHAFVADPSSPSGQVRLTVQSVGSYVTVTAPRGPGETTELVVIGTGIDVDEVRSRWAGTQVADGESVDDRAILSISRYLV